MQEDEDDWFDTRSYFDLVKSTLLHPIQILFSPTLLRTYLHTILLALTSLSLLAVAIIAYTSFYYAYIPARGITVAAHLQFQHPFPASTSSSTGFDHSTSFPYAVSRIGGTGNSGLVSRQKYDVVVELDLPRSERNLGAGNWMVGLELRGPGGVGDRVGKVLGLEWEEEFEEFSWGENAGRDRRRRHSSAAESEKLVVDDKTDGGTVLARSRRPGILTYRSWSTEMVYRLLRLPFYVIGWGQESEMVQIVMMEGVEFDKGWRNVPSLLRLEVRSRRVLEVYGVRVRFVARLGGLRYIMHTHRILSFIVFTSLFWAVETTLLLLTWGIITFLFPPSSPPPIQNQKTIKKETDSPTTATSLKYEPSPTASPSTSHPPTPLSPSFSDSSRTFPSLSKHAPLHYSAHETRIKRETRTPGLEDVPRVPWGRGEEVDEGDDEDEDADFVLGGLQGGMVDRDRDSGIGSSTGANFSGEKMGGGRGKGKGVVRRRSAGGGSG